MIRTVLMGVAAVAFVFIVMWAALSVGAGYP